MIRPFASLALALSLGRASAATTTWKQKCQGFTTLPAIPESINASLIQVDYYAAGALFNETDPNTSLESTRSAFLSVIRSRLTVEYSFKAFCRVQINITTSSNSSAVSEIWSVLLLVTPSNTHDEAGFQTNGRASFSARAMAHQAAVVRILTTHVLKPVLNYAQSIGPTWAIWRLTTVLLGTQRTAATPPMARRGWLLTIQNP